MIPPTVRYQDPSLPTAGSGGFELYRGTTLLYALPLSLKPGTVGGELNLTLDRAPFSAVPVAVGDALAAPEFVTLTGSAHWSDYQTATVAKSLIRQAARQADRLVFGGLTYTQLQPGFGDARFTDQGRPLDSDISVRLVPIELLTPEGIAERAQYLFGLLAVAMSQGGVVTATPVPGAAFTAGTYTLNGANGATFTLATQTIDYVGFS